MGLLEREGHLGRLMTALASARDGHGRIVFVGGEAGIGKTVLAEAFTAGLSDDVRVAYGRCDALATPRALGPFVDVAAALGIEAARARDELLTALLGALRQGPPTVVVIEDAHWADAPTADLVALLGRRLADLPLLLLVTYRDEELGTDHPLRRALGTIATARGASWLGLGPLSRHGVRQLADVAGASADELYRLTGGNPFYVTEMLAAPPGSIATSVRLAVLARASSLSSAARAVLDAGSVIPGQAEEWLLAAICSAEAAAVDECVAAGVLLVDDAGYRFRHELARRAVEGELAVSNRRDLHARAATTLAGRADSDPARTAFHAELGGDDELVALASAAACRQALERDAYPAAVAHAQRALRCAGRLGPDEVADLQVDLADALGALGREDEAIVLANAAAAHWGTAEDARREAVALEVLSRLLTARGRSAEAAQAGRRAVGLLERLPSSERGAGADRGRAGSELVRAYVRMCGVHMLAREREPAVEWGERAIDLAEQLGDTASLAYALIQRGCADLIERRFEGLDQIERGIAVARGQEQHRYIALGLSQIGSGCGELRRYDRALPALVEARAHSDRHQMESQRQYIVAWLARCQFDLGRWDQAEQAAFDVLSAPSTAIARFVALNTLGWLRARRGDDDVWPALDEALTIARRTGHLQRLWPCAVARAEAGWLEGDLDAHVDLLEEQVDLAVRCRHEIAVGELGVWLGRAGKPVVDPGAEPFAGWNRGDHQAAAAGFRSIGCPYEAASALACTGETASLGEAYATFDRLGAAPAADRVATELRGRGVRVARTAAPSAAANSGGLSDREVDVIRLVAAGFTNPQIGEALYISRKTAEHHVSNILMKLGAATRTEAATMAMQLGLVLG